MKMKKEKPVIIEEKTKHTKEETLKTVLSLMEPIEKEEQNRKTSILGNAATIISTILFCATIILYQYNSGYCVVFNIPANAITLSLERYAPICALVIVMQLYILHYYAEIKTDAALQRKNINWMRLLYGFFISMKLLEYIGVNRIIDPWLHIIISLAIPLMIEFLIRLRKSIINKTNDKAYSELEYIIQLENHIHNRILYKGLVRNGLIIIILAVILSPLFGRVSALAKRDYQICFYDNKSFAVIVDNNEYCIIQEAIIEDKNLRIYTCTYQTIEKKEIPFTYIQFNNVSIHNYHKLDIDSPKSVIEL